MPEAFDLCEIRLVQRVIYTSAANADNLSSGIVPDGKIWTIIGLGYSPSVAETQTINIQKYERAGGYLSLLNPVSLALNPAVAGIDYGLTVQLYPGEFIRVLRGTHTAGSTMSFVMQFIETDLPLYDYIEPQAAARVKRFASSIAQRVSGGSGGAASHPTMASRTGRSRPLPK